MSKAKTKTKSKSKIQEGVKKQFGDGIMLSANSVVDQNLVTIPVSPCLDLVLNGGVPEGSFMIFTVHPKCGKTTTSLDFAATAQRLEYAHSSFADGRDVYYLNIEGRLKKRDLEGIPGLNLDKFHVIGSQQGKILHAEEYLSIGERIINEEPGSVVIIDSYSALCTEAEITADMGKMQRADGAKLLAKFCRKVANVIPVNKNVVIGITHLMGNPGHGNVEFKEKSGQSIAYQTDVKLRATYFEPWRVGKDDTQIGQKIHWIVNCSALGPPGGKITSFLRYGEGIDRAMEVFNLAKDIGLVDQAGAWYTISCVKDTPKFQGEEKARNYIASNPDVYESIWNQVKETMGI